MSFLDSTNFADGRFEETTMHELTVYAKSAKGRQEIATRANKLNFKQRTLLIMVDGASSLAMLRTKASAVGDIDTMLSELRDQGFIEPVASSTEEAGKIAPSAASSSDVAAVASATAASAASPDVAVQATEAADMNLPAAKLAAVKFLEKTLGPDAVDFNLRLGESKTSEEFLQHAEKCVEILQQVKGAQFADEFWGRIEQHVVAAAA